MPNIFIKDYSQFPDDLLEHMRGIKKVPSFKLLLLVLRRVNQYGSMRVKISTREAKVITGLSDNNLTDARRELDTLGLLRSDEVNNQGMWLYQLLDPATRDVRPSRKDRIDFTEQLDYVADYFIDRLKRFDPEKRADGKWRSRCPFHTSSKMRERPFEFGPGDGGSGVWYCHVCNKGGSTVDLEYDLAIEKGRPLTRAQAVSNVRVAFQSLAMARKVTGAPAHDSDSANITL